MGPRKLLALLQRRDGKTAWPAASTIGDVLKRAGLSDYADCLSRAPRVEKFKAAGAVKLGAWGTEICSELVPRENEIVFTKTSANAFFNTPLLAWLYRNGMERLILTGVVTNLAVESAARFADDAGFSGVVASDCCAASSKEMHDFAVARTLPIFSEVRPSGEIINLISAAL
jgi:nicotinamidase-related amidase